MNHDTRDVVKVFLASPGDLQDERRVANDVVDYFNKIWADQLGYQVELVDWEDTVSVYGRPQALINLDLEQCEYFVGVLWRRWGTPPDVSGSYTSGFEEEFENAVRRRQKDGRPEISLFFKSVDEQMLRDPGDELKKVLLFKQKIIDDKSILFEQFVDIRDFEKKLHRCVAKYVQKLPQKDIGSEATFREGDTSHDAPAHEAPLGGDPRFPPEAVTFLRNLLVGGQGGTPSDAISPSDAARFRLLAETTKTPQNDKRGLGVHDANILYVERSRLGLSAMECRGLVEIGLEHYRHENTPLWYWLSMIDGFHGFALPMYSVVGETNQRIAALAAMRLVSVPLPSGAVVNRQFYIESWFSDDTADVRVEALRYLAEFGLPTDLPAIRTEFERAEYRTTPAAADAVVRVLLRDSRQQAVRALAELQPVEIDRTLLERLFGNGASIPSEVLLECIGHRNAGVRRRVTKLLKCRGDLDEQRAEQLTRDTDAEVRLLALELLVEAGREIADSEAKEILISATTRQAYRPIGLFASSDKEAVNALARFRANRLRALSEHELQARARAESISDRAADFLLIERNFSTRGDELRAAIDDGFKNMFDEIARRTVEGLGSASEDLAAQVRELEDYTRSKWMSRGFDIICRRQEIEDLGRVRRFLRDGVVELSGDAIEYLRRRGEWVDIELLIGAAQKAEKAHGIQLITIPDRTSYKRLAQVMLYLAQGRISELLSIPMPGALLSRLISAVADKLFAALGQSEIVELLRFGDSDVRKAVALKCVRTLPKGRLIALLDDYLAGDSRIYYNVVHWLDLGASTTRERARAAAAKVMAIQWFV